MRRLSIFVLAYLLVIALLPMSARAQGAIIETLEDEAAWKETLARAPDKLRRLAEEALHESRQGQTRPLDEIL